MIFIAGIILHSARKKLSLSRRSVNHNGADNRPLKYSISRTGFKAYIRIS